ncbi:protein jag [Patescibacteria group bacterium]
MLNNLEVKIVEETVKEFFDRMGFEVDIKVNDFDDKTLPIELTTEDPKILIGEGGRTLAEAQHILKALLVKKLKTVFFVNLDINEYKKKKYQYLRESARVAADEVALSKKEKSLSPMGPAERRVVHLELAERKDVFSESIGQEPERKIIIKPSV